MTPSYEFDRATLERLLALRDDIVDWDIPRAPRAPSSDPHRRWPVAKLSPRERPELGRPLPELDDDAVTDWVRANPIIRGGFRPATQRALAFLDTFAPK